MEYGQRPLPQTANARQALDEAYSRAKELAKANELDEIDAGIYIRHYTTLKKIAGDHAPKVQPIAELLSEWHFGPSGTGKSRTVRETYPDAFIKNADRWWDGYQGESVVILEDIDIYDIKLGRYLKLWGDHYSFPAECKYEGKRDIRPDRIIVTSNYHPKDIWSDERTWGPILRRYRIVEYGTTPMERVADGSLNRTQQVHAHVAAYDYELEII